MEMNNEITLKITVTRRIRVAPQQASSATAARGKLNYLTGPGKRPVKKQTIQPQRPRWVQETIEESRQRGRFLKANGKTAAFVWLDEDGSAPVASASDIARHRLAAI